MTAWIILGIFFALAAFGLMVPYFKTRKNAKSINQILAHAPKDEDKLQK